LFEKFERKYFPKRKKKKGGGGDLLFHILSMEGFLIVEPGPVV
jgi:hypothetical protein